jgi:serine phosphatase RsbU (regulator of sigma subunit)
VSLSRVGLPLGLREAAETAAPYGPIPRGSVLVLYTDGLTESERDLLEGEASLHQALANPKIALGDHPAVALRDALVKEPAPDDVAILTVTFI